MTTDTNSRVVFGMAAGVVTDTGPKKEVHAPVQHRSALLLKYASCLGASHSAPVWQLGNC